MKKSEGFTLIELVVILILVGILAVTAVSRFASEETFALKTEQEQLIAALFQAQQLAMSGRPTQFAILSAGSFTVRDSGDPANHYELGHITYPQNLNSTVAFNPASLVRNYNGLGETTETTITLSAGSDSVSVCLETSGYAHGC